MGCDIHPYAEVRVKGQWKRLRVHIPNNRNYYAFSVLAGVRNGFGFAGVVTGETVKPIAEPRGLPKDRATFKSQHGDDSYDDPEYVSFGDHSYSWVTLRELLDYDLERPITIVGIITRQQKKDLDAGTNPDTWCSAKSRMTEDDIHATWETPLKEAAFLIPKIISRLQEATE